MSKPLRVLVWGPGGLGSICVREVLQKREFELAGVFAYSESKAGQDAGELVGVAAAGVVVTASREEALSIDCDCVIYLARDLGNYHYTDEVLQILEAGKNLISVLPMQNLDHLGKACDPKFPQKLQAACEKGQSTFHCTGIHPAFVAERLAAPLTGLCGDISQLKVQENWDVAHISAPQLQVVGYGLTPEEAKAQPFASLIADNYITINAESMAKALGVTFDRTDVEHEFTVTDKDIDTEFLSIKAGTVGLVTHRHKGYIDEFGSEPFQIFEVNWPFTHAMYPEGITPDQYYVVTAEGRPSVKLSLDIQSSFANPQHFVIDGDPASAPGYYATVSTCMHAVPKVISAAPGVLQSPVTDWHWSPDYRNLL